MIDRHIRPLAKSLLFVAIVVSSLLLIPLIAMQLTREVGWGAGDFAAAGTVLFTAGAIYTLWSSKLQSRKQRAIATRVLSAALLLVWAELAVGLFT